jgi:sugar phosphate isomerase/epimerase
MRGDGWEAYVRELIELGSRWGVSFRQSHLPYYDIFRKEEPDPTMEELIRRSIIASGMMGVEWAVTHPGTVYSAGHDMSVSLEKNVEYYSRHVQTAREAGIGICLENDFEYHPSQPRQRIYCASVCELVALVDAFRDPGHVGVCYDFGHGNLVGNPFHRKNLNIIGSRLRAIHVQDNHGTLDEHLMPFHGNIDWAECMAGLADIGYKGDLTYEIQEFGRYLPNDQKHLVVDYSRKIGKVLVEMFEAARAAQGQ